MRLSCGVHVTCIALFALCDIATTRTGYTHLWERGLPRETAQSRSKLRSHGAILLGILNRPSYELQVYAAFVWLLYDLHCAM